ncbi:MAG: RnfABCDGE type electron transport complex subunit G [Granulosicoccaceae bacterium]
MLEYRSKLNQSGFRLSLGVATAVIVTALVFVITKQQRKQSSQLILSRQIGLLLPTGAYENNPATDRIQLNKTISSSLTLNSAYLYKSANTVRGAIFHVTTSQGYSGDIELLVALAQSKLVHGVALVAHTETPGLGDKIELGRTDWLSQFTGLHTTSMPPSAWSVKKDGGAFDQITGATITPRAVINAVSDTINWYSRHPDSLQ